MKKTALTTAMMTAFLANSGANATGVDTPSDIVRVKVTIENLAPNRGSFLTPFWVGLHNGEFDTYDGNTPANSDPQPGSVAMERLCEDGDTMAITEDFAMLSNGVDATLLGSSGPIAPGETTMENFLVDPLDPDTRYFSYASMIIPSNDFCVSNGNPLAHPIFDEHGNVVAEDFFVTGAEVLDAGTEVNDEVPENTAFFGQQQGNTGVDENGNIGDAGELENFQGLIQPEDGGNILSDPRFAMSDFTVPGYPVVKISFAIAPAIIEDIKLASRLSSDQEVPPVDSDATGKARYRLKDEGTQLAFHHRLNLDEEKIVAAHLHLGKAGENGPVVAFLFDDSNRDERLTSLKSNHFHSRLKGELTTQDLTGPLKGALLDELVAEILDGNVYINIHTAQYPDGEIRGQLSEITH